MTDILAELDAADWHDIPRGYYAVEIRDMDDEDDYPILGYHLCERKVPRGSRGRGRDRWDVRTVAADGIEFNRLRDYLDDNRGDPEHDRRLLIADVLWNVRNIDNHHDYRRVFGRLKGRCGCCGKTLTDPDSKMRGIGPECWKGLQP